MPFSSLRYSLSLCCSLAANNTATPNLTREQANHPLNTMTYDIYETFFQQPSTEQTQYKRLYHSYEHEHTTQLYFAKPHSINSSLVNSLSKPIQTSLSQTERFKQQ